MSQAWWANPPQWFSLQVAEILGFLPAPIAGMLGFLLFFTLLVAVPAGIIRLCGIRL
jgi:hypothetical protein